MLPGPVGAEISSRPHGLLSRVPLCRPETQVLYRAKDPAGAQPSGCRDLRMPPITLKAQYAGRS